MDHARSALIRSRKVMRTIVENKTNHIVEDLRSRENESDIAAFCCIIFDYSSICVSTLNYHVNFLF